MRASYEEVCTVCKDPKCWGELDHVVKANEQIDNCDCGGSPSKPWNYCDDCSEARELLERITE